jgi:hypothetical protein
MIASKTSRKAFLVRRWLPFIGALTVFATFVIKDAMREHVKSLADSLDAAESVFILRSSNAATPSAFAAIHEHIEGTARRMIAQIQHKKMQLVTTDVSGSFSMIGMEYVGKEGIKANIENYLSIFGMMNSTFESNRRALENTSRLLDRLNSGPNETKSKISELDGKLLQFHDTADQLDVVPAKMTDTEWLAKMRTALGELLAKSEPTLSEIAGITNQVFAEAEVRRTTAERRYKLFTWCSYGLYLLGWSLGLLGSLYKIEGLPGAE